MNRKIQTEIVLNWLWTATPTKCINVGEKWGKKVKIEKVLQKEEEEEEEEEEENPLQEHNVRVNQVTNYMYEVLLNFIHVSYQSNHRCRSSHLSMNMIHNDSVSKY